MDYQSSSRTQALVKQKMPQESDEVRDATVALIDALKRRAMSEAKSAGDWTRNSYLQAIEKAKENVDQTQHLAETYRAKLDDAVRFIQEETETNWDIIVQEFDELGTRLSEAADAAWETLTQPRSDSSQ